MELKIWVDKKKDRLLFAEAYGDVVDTLFSFLTLPFGTVVKLISKAQSHTEKVGCFNTLYESLLNLHYSFPCSVACKDMLLKPRSSIEELCQKLETSVAGYRKCSNCFQSSNKTKCCCGWFMDMETPTNASTARKDQVFVAKSSKFIVTDNLHVRPVTPGVVLGLLRELGIEDMNVLQPRNVKLGFYEGTLLSKTPLTDVFLHKKNLPWKLPLDNLLCQRKPSLEQADEVKVNVKVMLKKSSKKVLFLEAGEDFVNFLFSFVAIPLGHFLHIFDAEYYLGSIDGLYKSALALDCQYFSSENHKNMLLIPKLAPPFNCKNRLFPLETKLPNKDHTGNGSTGELGGFVRGPADFIVLDNLLVTPFTMDSVISILKKNNCSLKDLEERTISIGISEGLSIVRASLSSTNALTNGLLHKLT